MKKMQKIFIPEAAADHVDLYRMEKDEYQRVLCIPKSPANFWIGVITRTPQGEYHIVFSTGITGGFKYATWEELIENAKDVIEFYFIP